MPQQETSYWLIKKTLAIAGIMVLTTTSTASFADHLEPKESKVRPLGNLSHTDLSGRDLIGANLFLASLRDANLSNADLRGASLWLANLKDANLSGADLSFASLIFASLRGSNLSGANLKDANLRDTDLRGANLSFANLKGVTAIYLKGCPSSLPNGWSCKKNSLIRLTPS